MEHEDYQHFVCIAAGDNPDELMKEYDKNAEVQPKLVFEYSKIDEIRKKFINMYELALKNDDLNPAQIEYIKSTIKDISEMDDDDFYYEIVSDGDLIIGKDGNAYSKKNDKGRWSSYSVGKIFSIPFYTKDGREVFQAKKGEIDWPSIHLHGGDIYARAWEMVVDGDKPTNDYEKTIYENMKDKVHYFEKFETKENYVISNTAFWGYAFVSDKTGWIDADDEEDQFAWMRNFYDVFIKNLDDDTLLTIFECRK